MKIEDKNNKWKTIFWFLSVVVVWILAPSIFHWITYLHGLFAVRSEMGDPFAAISALFSGLAFVGLVLTIQLQQKDISLQLTEMKATREELQRTAQSQEDQLKLAYRAALLNAYSAKLYCNAVILDPQSGMKAAVVETKTGASTETKRGDVASAEVLTLWQKIEDLIQEHLKEMNSNL